LLMYYYKRRRCGMARHTRKNRAKLVFQLSLICGLLWFPFYAGTAAEYPEKPVNLMVSLAAGGTTDLITRVLAEGSG
jgi:tripartite-type tricarboxylate transporter receptor subunit TctC